MESPSADRIPQEEAAHRSPNRPVALRPSRRPLLWAVPVAVAVLVTGVRGMVGGTYLGAVFGPVLILDVFVAAMILKLLRGRTVADATGIRNRLLFGTRTIPWREVSSLYVAPTLFGRIVTVSSADGRRYSLAAPREGLLGRDPRFDEALERMTALAAPKAVEVSSLPVRAVRVTVWVLMAAFAAGVVFLWRPWVEPWWPGRDEAGSLPAACAIVDLRGAAWMPPSPEPSEKSLHDGAFFANAACAYRSSQGADAPGRVDLEMNLERRTSSTGGTEEARAEYAEAREAVAESVRARSGRDKDWTAAMGDVAGLGDQAWRSVALERGTGETEVRIVMRKANVLVEIDHAAERPRAEVVAAADALAREALHRLDGR